MKIAIITSISSKSARELAEHLRVNGIQADVFHPYKDGRSDFRAYDYVFSYGCSAETEHKQRINSPKAIKRCIDKVATFKTVTENNAVVPIPRWWVDKRDIPADAYTIVVRKKRDGNKATGLEYWYRDSGQPIPNGELYTDYFYHKREYRVVFFQGQCFIYYKHYDKVEDSHEFRLQRLADFEKMHMACSYARVKLGIEFVAFDVVAKSKNDFVILEANSGGALTPEVSTAIVEYFLNK